MSFVDYSAMICKFEKEIYDYGNNYKEDLKSYNEILEKNGIEWLSESMKTQQMYHH